MKARHRRRADAATPIKRMSLTPKQRQFVDSYVRHGNAQVAAVEAGYARDRARQAAHEILKNEKVTAEIERRQLRLAVTALAGFASASIPVRLSSVIKLYSTSGLKTSAWILILFAFAFSPSRLKPHFLSSFRTTSSRLAASSKPKPISTCLKSSVSILPDKATTARPSFAAKVARFACWPFTAICTRL